MQKLILPIRKGKSTECSDADQMRVPGTQYMQTNALKDCQGSVNKIE